MKIEKIKVKNLNLYYGKFWALKNISAKIHEKSVTAIIGPSGCGKSTFIRCLNRMNDLIPEVKIEGNIIIDGANIYDLRMNLVNLRKKVGMVFQRPNPFPLSIYENIVYGPKIHGILKKSTLDDLVEKCLSSVLLWNEVKEDLQKNALLLSLEKQQRLCIARVLSIKPEIILMDEPCSALDPVATLKIEELIRDLSKDFTIVIVTHNMQQAARISHKTAFMLLGDLVEFASTEKIFTNPVDKRTEDYVSGRYG